MNDHPTDEEMEAAFRQSLAFNADATRAGLFAAAVDIADEMKKAGIAHADAAILTGAAEMVAQLWQQVAREAGIPPATARKNLLKEVSFFFGKHVRASRAPKASIN